MMSAQDLDSAIASAIRTRDMLIETVKVADAVEAMILFEVMKKSTEVLNTLVQLNSAIRSAIEESSK